MIFLGTRTKCNSNCKLFSITVVLSLCLWQYLVSFCITPNLSWLNKSLNSYFVGIGSCIFNRKIFFLIPFIQVFLATLDDKRNSWYDISRVRYSVVPKHHAFSSFSSFCYPFFSFYDFAPLLYLQSACKHNKISK